MKRKLGFSVGVPIGSAAGTVIYELLRGSTVDWIRAAFIAVVTFSVSLILAKKKFA